MSSLRKQPPHADEVIEVVPIWGDGFEPVDGYVTVQRPPRFDLARTYQSDCEMLNLTALILNGSVIEDYVAILSGAAAAGLQATTWPRAAAGVLELQAGTAANGRAGLLQTGSLRMTQQEIRLAARVCVPTLSTAAQEFTVCFGLGDNHVSTNFVEPTNGLYWLYDRASFGDFWVLAASNAGTKERIVSTVAVPANGWTTLELHANIDGEFCHGRANGDRVGVLSTQLPASTVSMFCGIKIQKTVGTTSRSLYVDHLRQELRFGGERA